MALYAVVFLINNFITFLTANASSVQKAIFNIHQNLKKKTTQRTQTLRISFFFFFFLISSSVLLFYFNFFYFFLLFKNLCYFVHHRLLLYSLTPLKKKNWSFKGQKEKTKEKKEPSF